MKLVEGKDIGDQIHNACSELFKNHPEISDVVNDQLDILEKMCKCRFVGDYESINRFDITHAIFENDLDFTWFLLRWS